MADTKGITYVRMMLDVLTKKEVYLKDLLTLTTEQEKILKQEEFDEDSFNTVIKKKDGIIKKLDELDQLPLMKRIKILVRYFVYGKKS